MRRVGFGSVFTRVLRACALAAVAGSLLAVAQAENVDPKNDGSQYAYGENIGWINAEPAGNGGPGMQVNDSSVSGYLWGENVGWINLNCTNNATCGSVNYGVTNDGAGHLGGYAWGENIGWISFSCSNNPGTCATTGDYGVTVDVNTGILHGYAWSENTGWISFNDDSPYPYATLALWSNDADADGCTAYEESGANPSLGGSRNPNYYWDFYDVDDGTKSGTRDKKIDLKDALMVLQHFGHSDVTDALDANLDRQVLDANFPWRSSQATNGIDLKDALAVLKSFGGGCTAAP